VDALEVEVIRRDIRQDADLIRLVSDAAEDDAASGRLEDRDVDIVATEDLSRTTRTGPVTGVDEPLVDEHPVGCRRPDMATREQEDVRDEAGDSALAVRAADGDDRDAPLRVPNPGRRARPGRSDPPAPAGDGPFLAWCQMGPSTRGRVPLGERKRRLGDRLGSFGAAPRKRHQPVARVRRQMDGHTPGPLVELRSKAADPCGHRRDGPWLAAQRDRRAEADERVARRCALAIPGPTPPDGDLDLHDRLEPVDVWSLEQSDLDEAHGSGRITSRRPGTNTG
jgi:hypothetical protein